METINRTKIQSIRALVSTMIFFTFLAQPCYADYNFRVISKLGDPAPPAVVGGTHDGDFEPQAINNNGNVMFVSDNSTLDSEGLYLNRKGKESRILGPGYSIPGALNHLGGYGILGPGDMNENGDMAVTWSTDVAWKSPLDIVKSAVVLRYDAAKNRLNKVLVAGDEAPGDTYFRGAYWNSEINNRGMVVAVGMVDTDYGVCQNPKDPCYGLGLGVYVADNKNKLSKIAVPGGPAPGGGKFDSAEAFSINDSGDIAFGAHVTGEQCLGFDHNVPRCFTSQYLYRASTGKISSIAHQGDPIPGLSGKYFGEVFGGRINNVGDMVYIGNISPTVVTPGVESLGVFLTDRKGKSRLVVKPGDHVPGGTIFQTGFNPGQVDINNSGIVVFAAQLVDDVDNDGNQDTGVYVYSRGKISTVVRTGTVIPGIGKVAIVNNTYSVGSYPTP
ncbi:MAG: choice-of-anchor tandem repeat NxxGxxAF-containing protein [Methylococcaceae bacterium]